MRIILLAGLVFFPFAVLLAQSETKKQPYTFIAGFGKSKAGSGDVAGLYIKLGVQKKVKRWNFSLSQVTTIHDGSHPIFYEFPAGHMNDGSIRFTVTGLELVPMAGYSFIRSSRHDLQFSLGAVLRYQSDGDNASYSLYYPAATGLPFPVLVMHNWSKLRTFAVGPVGQLSYDFVLNRHWLLGGSGSFQFDSNGDNFLNYGLRVGYRL